MFFAKLSKRVTFKVEISKTGQVWDMKYSHDVIGIGILIIIHLEHIFFALSHQSVI